eukprot:jgi/Bigna1/130169/aug1.10_g4877
MVGLFVGETEGNRVAGDADGIRVTGTLVVGEDDGDSVGLNEGDMVVGESDGDSVGLNEGDTVDGEKDVLGVNVGARVLKGHSKAFLDRSHNGIAAWTVSTLRRCLDVLRKIHKGILGKTQFKKDADE